MNGDRRWRSLGIRKSNRGSLLVETLCACLVLTIIFAGLTEIVLLMQDQIGVIRVAREGARETALTGSIEAGEEKARQVASLYLKTPVEVTITVVNAGDLDNVVCNVTTVHRPLFNILRGGGVVLHEEAIFHFKDYRG